MWTEEGEGYVPHGIYGLYNDDEGRIHCGAWKEGKEHGPGIEMMPDNRIPSKTGNWDNGVYISPVRRLSENEPEIEEPAQQNNVHSINTFIAIIITTIAIGMMIILSFFIYIR